MLAFTGCFQRGLIHTLLIDKLLLHLFITFLSLEMAYNVMAVDNTKKPIKINVMDAKAIFVTILCA